MHGKPTIRPPMAAGLLAVRETRAGLCQNLPDCDENAQVEVNAGKTELTKRPLIHLTQIGVRLHRAVGLGVR